MASDLNRCEFIGRLGRDVELKQMKSGDCMATFSIACGESYLNKQGEKVKKTEWINIIAYRKLGEICSKYLCKGSLVYIAGKFSTNKYTAKDGTERYSTNVIANEMQMLGGTKSADQPAHAVSEQEAFSNDFDSDDVPF
jgi:single-strand DNA-binding protein